MALSVSRRLLRRFGSFSAFNRCNFSRVANHFSPTPCDSYGVSSGCKSFTSKGGSFLLACRKLSTTILTPDSSDGGFPSDLLSKKTVLTPDRTIGLCQDLVIPVTSFLNEDKGFMVLAGDVFDVPIRKDIIHRVVRWQLAKRQQGTHSTKTISEVSGTGRKPWRQKGTGRARHGTLRGPQFRGGATMHGPKPRSHAFKLNKKVRRLGLKIALSARAAEGKGLNVYSILLHDTLVMSRDAVNRIVERMHTPINR
ncbi:50S ribosomal protein L4-like isoform X2 [Mangifera indica]|uniref:50S ribosomal protein L4-like isoform X2 n=1 Tax=Mangifera indica TaxID=29780 RepID=UPI001CFA90FD|nr:50S ribosomal protein L4-like isoform X2 [Mangifera indica]